MTKLLVIVTGKFMGSESEATVSGQGLEELLSLPTQVLWSLEFSDVGWAERVYLPQEGKREPS